MVLLVIRSYVKYYVHFCWAGVLLLLLLLLRVCEFHGTVGTKDKGQEPKGAEVSMDKNKVHRKRIGGSYSSKFREPAAVNPIV